MKKKVFLLSLLIILLLGIIFITTNDNHYNNKTLKDNANGKTGRENISQNNNKDEGSEEIKQSDSDVIGEIKIDGTNINNQIVQGEDNDFYLNYSEEKDPDIKGSIFLDYRNTLYDRKLLIYGHNSEVFKDIPFHELEKYTNKEFYNQHRFINLTLNENKSKWEIFSVMIVNENSSKHTKITFNDNEYLEHIDWLKSSSIYKIEIDVNKDDRLLMLQTCYYNPKNSYLIISAKKVE